MAGRIHQINVSGGGVPKRAVPSAMITVDGVEGDRQEDLEHHGGPDKAVCLYSLEVIQALRAEGHPIQAGSAGENLTLSELVWASIGPGTRLTSGDVELEVVFPATPCSKNAQWFSGGNFNRIHQAKYPGWSRMYARVLSPGRITTGDRIEIAV